MVYAHTSKGMVDAYTLVVIVSEFAVCGSVCSKFVRVFVCIGPSFDLFSLVFSDLSMFEDQSTNNNFAHSSSRPPCPRRRCLPQSQTCFRSLPH